MIAHSTVVEPLAPAPVSVRTTDDVDWYPPARKRTSWGAVFAAVITALGLQAVFAVLGIAVGLTTGDAYLSESQAKGMGIAAGIWWLVTGTAALFAGGWVAGRLAGAPRNVDGMLHGFVTWGLATVIGAFVVTTAMGAVVGGAMGNLQRELSLSTRARYDNFDGSSTAYRGRTPSAMLASDPASRPRATDDDAVTITTDRGEEVVLTREEAEAARKQLAVASWWTFVALLLGAGAATLGGRLGIPHYDEDERLIGTHVHPRARTPAGFSSGSGCC